MAQASISPQQIHPAAHQHLLLLRQQVVDVVLDILILIQSQAGLAAAEVAHQAATEAVVEAVQLGKAEMLDQKIIQEILLLFKVFQDKGSQAVQDIKTVVALAALVVQEHLVLSPEHQLLEQVAVAALLGWERPQVAAQVAEVQQVQAVAVVTATQQLVLTLAQVVVAATATQQEVAMEHRVLLLLDI
jgi:hypothetical protein